MSWIKKVTYEESKGRLRKIYDRIVGPNGYIDNVLTIHGQRPHTLEGHMTLYKSVLHHSGNKLPKWFLESLGVYVSYINDCNYCFEHHYEGMKSLIKDDERSVEIRKAVLSNDFSTVFTLKEQKMIQYANKLTLKMGELLESDVKQLLELGFSEGEVLEANQVIAYFNYANRSVVGLGVSTEGDILGLSPGESDEAGNCSHDLAKK